MEIQTIREKAELYETLETRTYKGIMSIIHDKQKCMMPCLCKILPGQISLTFRRTT